MYAYFSGQPHWIVGPPTSDREMSLGLAINHSYQGCKATKKYWHFNAKDYVEMAKSFHPKDWQFVLSEDVTDINQLWSKWKKQFFHEVEKFVPTSLRRPSSKRFPPWFTKHVRRLITTKHRLYRRAVRSRLYPNTGKCTAQCVMNVTSLSDSRSPPT